MYGILLKDFFIIKKICKAKKILLNANGHGHDPFDQTNVGFEPTSLYWKSKMPLLTQNSYKNVFFKKLFIIPTES